MPRQVRSPATQQRHLTSAVAELQQQLRDTYTFCADDDTLAAAMTCALPATTQRRADLEASCSWLRCSADPWSLSALERLQQILKSSWSAKVETAVANVITAASNQDSGLWILYELLLSTDEDRSRRATGSFYTPPQIARYLVAQTDRRLREQLALPEGIAGPNITILEPACGCGEFVIALLESLSGTGREIGANCVHPDRHDSARPSLPTPDFSSFLKRLIAIDISPVALFITKLRMALKLRDFGVDVSCELPQLQLVLGNALAGPSEVANLQQPITVVIGNPPFSSLSTNEQPWIQSLIRGNKNHAGYFSIDGEQLGERKTWLHDDYVKFLRLAQWCIEQNGQGVVSLVTNHGWLDNATFRIARQQLLRTFSHIDVVDLHGNAKRHEVNPGGERDENVFGIAQGIALVTATKTHAPATTVARADLWGSRASKLQQLAQGIDEPLAVAEILPAAPWFTFAAQGEAAPQEYAAAPLLTEIMPVNSTVPVTARDHFVVAATREELLERLAEFCDPHISDDEIRQKYFQRTRSNRYEPGDTRSWKLPAARRTFMNEADAASCIRRCLYRPFVWRYVLWHPAIVDWPRTEFTRHFEEGNLALLARRQSIAGREANFFWITDALPLDGVIRSDNRGSESFFPLCLTSTEQPLRLQLNFASRACREFEPAKMLSYSYGLFHSPTYRTRYAAALAMEFPRVLLPQSKALFEKLAELGAQLIQIHRTDPLQTKITPNLDIALTAAIENFHVGTYNVCRKWLQLTAEKRDAASFAGLQQLICYTLQLQKQIEEAIATAGGFQAAFG